jgi:hypothetical protein
MLAGEYDERWTGTKRNLDSPRSWQRAKAHFICKKINGNKTASTSHIKAPTVCQSPWISIPVIGQIIMHPLPYKTLVEEWLRALETTLSDGYLILQASDLEDSSRAGAGNILLANNNLDIIHFWGGGECYRPARSDYLPGSGLLSNQLDQSQEPGIDDEDTSLNLARWILRKSLSETLFSAKLNRSFDFTN